MDIIGKVKDHITTRRQTLLPILEMYATAYLKATKENNQSLMKIYAADKNRISDQLFELDSVEELLSPNHK